MMLVLLTRVRVVDATTLDRDVGRKYIHSTSRKRMLEVRSGPNFLVSLDFGIDASTLLVPARFRPSPIRFKYYVDLWGQKFGVIGPPWPSSSDLLGDLEGS